jgi:hypothetical protein
MGSIENFIIEDFSVEPFKFSCRKHCCYQGDSGEIIPNDGNQNNDAKCAKKCNKYHQKQNMLPCGITPNKHSDSKQKKCYSYDQNTQDCFEMTVRQTECYEPNCWGTLNQCCPDSQ